MMKLKKKARRGKATLYAAYEAPKLNCGAFC